MELKPEQLEQFEKCYAVYRCPPGRKKKGESKKIWAKLNPGKKQAESMYAWILAFNRYQKEVNEPITFNRGFSVWLNNQGWEDDIPSVMEERAKQRQNICSGTWNKLPCRNEVIGPKFNLCVRCYANRDTTDLRDAFIRFGLARKHDEDKGEWIQRLKDIAKSKITQIGRIP